MQSKTGGLIEPSYCEWCLLPMKLANIDSMFFAASESCAKLQETHLVLSCQCRSRSQKPAPVMIQMKRSRPESLLGMKKSLRASSDSKAQVVMPREKSQDSDKPAAMVVSSIV